MEWHPQSVGRSPPPVERVRTILDGWKAIDRGAAIFTRNYPYIRPTGTRELLLDCCALAVDGSVQTISSGCDGIIAGVDDERDGADGVIVLEVHDAYAGG